MLHKQFFGVLNYVVKIINQISDTKKNVKKFAFITIISYKFIKPYLINL